MDFLIFLILISIGVLFLVFGTAKRSYGFCTLSGVMFLILFMVMNSTEGIAVKSTQVVAAVSNDLNYSIVDAGYTLTAVSDTGVYALSYLFLAVGFVSILYGILMAYESVYSKKYGM